MNSNRRKLPASIVIGVVLTGLVGLNTACASSSTGSDVFVPGSDSSRLQTLLNQRGWDARFDGAGSLIVRWDGQRSVATPQSPPATYDRFARALADRGWTSNRDANGNLLLWPKPPTQGNAQHTPLLQKHSRQANPATSEPNKGFVRFSQQLASLGWQTHFIRGGNLRLHPPGKQSTTHSIKQQPLKAHTRNGWDKLTSRLQHNGWLTQRTAHGALKFWRPSFTSHTPIDRSTNPTRLASHKSRVSRIPGNMWMPFRPHGLADFRKSVADRGWNLSRSSDGSLLLVPLG
ncbi:MAG: hypothetical protein QNJ78_07365 [Gammaproteobacteria bacterium]|nr:hypothetical protein [Gammaproteobacteria bacterium]